jgi:hypothetical protein
LELLADFLLEVLALAFFLVLPRAAAFFFDAFFLAAFFLADFFFEAFFLDAIGRSFPRIEIMVPRKSCRNYPVSKRGLA